MADIKYNTIPYSDFQNGDVIDAEKIDLNNKTLIDKQNEVITKLNGAKEEINRHKISGDHDDRYYPLRNGNSLNNKVNVLDAELTSIIKNTPSNIEVAQALVNANGTTFSTLKGRLDYDSSTLSTIMKNVRNYNAKSDAVVSGNSLVSGTDNTVALKSLLSSVKSSQGNTITFPTGKYLISDILTIDKDTENLVIDGNGSTLIFNNTTKDISNDAEVGRRGMFYIEGTTVSSTNITAYETYTAPYSTRYYQRMGKFTVTDVTQFAKGDMVVINIPTKTQTYNEFIPSMDISAKIIEIDTVNKFVYTDYYSPFNFSNFVFDSADRMYKVKCPKNITIKNFYLHDVSPYSNPDPWNIDYPVRRKSVSGIGAYICDNLTVENVHGVNTKFPVIRTSYTHTYNFDNISLKNPAFVSAGEGYVVQLNSSYKGDINQVYGEGDRHVVDFSGSAFAMVRNSQSSNSIESSFDCHGICEHDIVFDNCIGGFGIGNGISAFPEITDNILIRNSKGRLIVNHASNITVENSELILSGIHVDESFTVSNSKIEFAPNTLLNYRSRGLGKRSKLFMSNVKIGSSYIPLGATTIIGINNFDTVEFNSTSIDFGVKPYVIGFTNITNMFMDNVYRNDTFFLFETLTALNINYKFYNMNSVYSAGFPLRLTYPQADRISNIRYSTGTIKFDSCNLKYNSTSASYALNVTDVVASGTNFEGSNLDLIYENCKFDNIRTGMLVINHNVIPQVSIYYVNNSVHLTVSETALKMSYYHLVKADDLRFKTATMENSWVSNASFPVGYQKNSNHTVTLHGIASGGTSNANGVVLFTLPTFHRPQRDLSFRVTTVGNGVANPIDTIRVNTFGQVILLSSDGKQGVYLNGITFSIL